MNTNVDLKTNLVAGALTSTHFTVRTAMPLLLGVLSSGYGFSDGELGALGSAYSVGATLVALSSVVWMRGLFLRLPAVLFLLLGLGALASIAFVRGYPLALATFLLAGIGFGGVYLLMIALLSRTESPNRSFGWQWGLGSLPGVLLLYAIPSFITVTDKVRPVFELIVAAIVFIGLATFVLTFGTGIISMLDKGGQASGLPAAALGAGSILGPTIAGQLSETAGAGTMLLGCGLSLVTGLVAYVIAYRKTR